MAVEIKEVKRDAEITSVPNEPLFVRRLYCAIIEEFGVNSTSFASRLNMEWFEERGLARGLDLDFGCDIQAAIIAAQPLINHRREAEKNLSQVNIQETERYMLVSAGLEPLLEDYEEVALAKLIEQGGEEGSEAANIMYLSNLRLVANLAKKYRDCGLDYLDVLQAGNLGLEKGVRKYDWREGKRFSTYGAWWIRQEITRTLSQDSRTIRLPANVVEELNRVHRAKGRLTREGKEATLEAIGELADLSPDQVQDLLDLSNLNPKSLDTAIDPSEGENGDEKHDLIGETIYQSTLEEEVLESMFREYLSQEIEAVFSEMDLNPRQINVIRKRLMEVNGEMTLEQIAIEEGVSKQAIDKMVNKLKEKLVGALYHLREDAS